MILNSQIIFILIKLNIKWLNFILIILILELNLFFKLYFLLNAFILTICFSKPSDLCIFNIQNEWDRIIYIQSSKKIFFLCWFLCLIFFTFLFIYSFWFFYLLCYFLLFVIISSSYLLDDCCWWRCSWSSLVFWYWNFWLQNEHLKILGRCFSLTRATYFDCWFWSVCGGISCFCW